MAASDITSATNRGQTRERAAEYLLQRHRFRLTEMLPWLIAIGVFFVYAKLGLTSRVQLAQEAARLH